MTVQYNTGTDYISAEIAVIDYSAAVLRMDKKPLVFCYLHQLFLLSVGILHIWRVKAVSRRKVSICGLAV